MPGSIEHIRSMWEQAEDGVRETYLFDALVILENQIQARFNNTNSNCLFRQSECGKRFVTKKETVIYGFIVLAVIIGIAIGAGDFTWVKVLIKALA